MSEGLPNLVEILDGGDIKFGGRLISSAELIVGTALCDLRNGVSQIDEKQEIIIPEDIKVIEDEEPAVENESAVKIDEPILKSDMTLLQPVVVPPLNIENTVRTHRKRKYEKVITLPPDDVRLTYIEQYVTAFNSSDAVAVKEMLQRIAIQNVVYVSKKYTPDPDHVIPAHMELVGIDAIVKTLEHYFFAVPDIVAKTQQEKINIYYNGESCIECNYELAGTKVFELSGMAEGSNDKVVLKSELDTLSDGLQNMKVNSKVMVNVESTEGGDVFKVPLGIQGKREKKHFVAKGTLQMHLNIEKKAFLIIFAKD